MEEIDRAVVSDREGDGYLYDFFKYLTSVSLVSMGGLFTFLQMEEAAEVPPIVKAITVVILGFSAATAFMGAHRFVQLRSTGQPIDREVRRLGRIAPLAYLIGFGALAYVCGDIIR
jgi:hypothetical protein